MARKSNLTNTTKILEGTTDIVTIPGKIVELSKCEKTESFYNVKVVAKVSRASKGEKIKVEKQLVLPFDEVKDMIDSWKKTEVSLKIGSYLKSGVAQLQVTDVVFNTKPSVSREKALKILDWENIKVHFEELKGDYPDNTSSLWRSSSVYKGVSRTIKILLEEISNQDFFDYEYCDKVFNLLQDLNITISSAINDELTEKAIKDSLKTYLRGILSIQNGFFKIQDEIQNTSNK